MVKGIGPLYAGKPVKSFGAAVFDVIGQSPERPREIPAIGEVRARRITTAIAREIADEVLFPDTVDGQPCVSLAPLYDAEQSIAARVRRVKTSDPGPEFRLDSVEAAAKST
ncbi:MAG: helicase, RecD/TraA family [Candidatus Accumulibacter adjunctus]|uniref:Helicase, RecD/TraA family n=1 Tax=Candidatus Accumulibacter adjunctus TaxID=1454001 RepID=A0A011NKV6_9PROT|nr:MAG: helicase, RecD/TraA family [Candidatus Accumulibacter adjunctus]